MTSNPRSGNKLQADETNHHLLSDKDIMPYPVQFRLPKDVYSEIKKLADQKNISVNNYCRESIEYLFQHGFLNDKPLALNLFQFPIMVELTRIHHELHQSKSELVEFFIGALEAFANELLEVDPENLLNYVKSIRAASSSIAKQDPTKKSL